MITDVSFIGFGEAAAAFSTDANWAVASKAYDKQLDDASLHSSKADDLDTANVEVCMTPQTALEGARIILSLVTADQSVFAACEAAAHVPPGALFLDMNSVAPAAKRAASETILASGGKYSDVAIMAPVYPKQLNVPLLVSGPWATESKEALIELGFSNVEVVGDEVGAASTIKMCRSVLIKGIEALTAECMTAASAAGVTEYVLASLGADWRAKANYNLERMLTHGTRRAAEMEEVCRTLLSLGVDPLMSEGTVRIQTVLGSIGTKGVPHEFSEKLKLLAPEQKVAAE